MVQRQTSEEDEVVTNGEEASDTNQYEIESLLKLDISANNNNKDNNTVKDKKCVHRHHHVPKISLPDHSEDEYGYSDTSHEDCCNNDHSKSKGKSKSKKSSDGGLKAVKDKVRFISLLYSNLFTVKI